MISPGGPRKMFHNTMPPRKGLGNGLGIGLERHMGKDWEKD